jgi:hypothetical protein
MRKKMWPLVPENRGRERLLELTQLFDQHEDHTRANAPTVVKLARTIILAVMDLTVAPGKSRVTKWPACLVAASSDAICLRDDAVLY